MQNESYTTGTHCEPQERNTLKQRRCARSTTNLPNCSITTGKVRSDQKVGRFMFVAVWAAFAILSTKHDQSCCRIPTLELRIRPHTLNTCGSITFHMGHTHRLCIRLSSGACLPNGGKGMTSIPQMVGCYTKSRSETPGAYIDRRSCNARPSKQPSRARPSHGGDVPTASQWG